LDSLEPQTEIRTRRTAENHHVRRGLYLLPSVFTVGTLVCGYYAILSSIHGTQLMAVGAGSTLAAAAFDNAAKAIGLAIVFDGLDGRIARLTNSTSNFGREFDSLADVITFGVAPALLAYTWGIRSVLDSSSSPWSMHLRQVAWIVTFAFVICGAARLARFNIETARSGADRRYFIGLPIPGAAGVIAAIVHWEKTPLQAWPSAMLWLAMGLLLSFLMVSRLRYYSFKAIDLRRRRSYLTIILLGLIVWGIFLYSEPVLLVMALSYLISGLVLRLISHFHPTAPPPEEVRAS
jgi:CDP-diacylglycerol---serine O-phosphatidyltransferase